MIIDFYATFNKRINSTKVPDGQPTRSLTGYLREPCSVLRPKLKIERLSSDEAPDSLTYAFIPAFSRYYFVNNWEWRDGLWQCEMSVDTLASWKRQIGECSEYIMRTDSTSDFNGAISDGMYPATTNFSLETTPFLNPFVETISQGTYIVGIINGESASAVGAINYYAMTPQQFGVLKQFLFSDQNLIKMGILDSQLVPLVEDISAEVLKTMYNPFQYIASCVWFPLLLSQIPHEITADGMRLGWWFYDNIYGYRVTNQTLTLTEAETMPEHPQVTRGKYLDYAPYTRRTLIGKFGTIPIDTAYFEVGSALIVYYYVDLISGISKVEIYTAENVAGLNRVKVAETDFLLGVPVQLAQIGRDYLGTAVSALDTAKDAGTGALLGALAGGIGGTAVMPFTGSAFGATAGAVAGAILSAGHGIYNTISTAMPQLRTTGTNGSFITALLSTVLISEFFVITDENITHKGRPLHEIRLIKNLSGYIECAEGDISFPCLLEEKQIIADHMTSGFFWE